MKILSMDHIHVYCRNVEASTAFYIKHFEAAEVMQNDNIHGQTRVFLSLGGTLIVLSPFPPGITAANPPPAGDGAYTHGFGVSHFGLRVPDVAAAVEELVRHGVEILGETVSEPTGLKYAYFAAPDGVVIELTQYG